VGWGRRLLCVGRLPAESKATRSRPCRGGAGGRRPAGRTQAAPARLTPPAERRGGAALRCRRARAANGARRRANEAPAVWLRLGGARTQAGGVCVCCSASCTLLCVVCGAWGGSSPLFAGRRPSLALLLPRSRRTQPAGSAETVQGQRPRLPRLSSSASEQERLRLAQRRFPFLSSLLGLARASARAAAASGGRERAAALRDAPIGRARDARSKRSEATSSEFRALRAAAAAARGHPPRAARPTAAAAAAARRRPRAAGQPEPWTR